MNGYIACFTPSVGLETGYFGVWFIRNSFVMDSSRWHECAHPPAYTALWPQVRQVHSSHPGPVHRCCLLWLLDCSCHKPMCNSKPLVSSSALGSTRAFFDPWNTSGCWLHASGFFLQKPQSSSGSRLCGLFYRNLHFSHKLTLVKPGPGPGNETYPYILKKTSYIFFLNCTPRWAINGE